MLSYQSLQTPQDIRILILDPGKPSDEIRCSLKRVFLPDHPHFEALSYVWGNPSNPQTITCLEERIEVTVNLYEALQHLRLTESPRILWVDAICINQNDLQERGQQVGLMGTIYSEADQVLVFLGKMTAEVERSLSQIAWLDRFLANNDEGYSIGTVLYDEPRDGSVWTGELADYSEEGFDWEPVMELLRRPWFGRLWIVQEVVLANRAIVFCGNESLPWGVVEKVFGTLAAHGLLEFFPQKANTLGGQNITAMGIIKQHRRFAGKEPKLIDLVPTMRNVQCTDPRDRVFALLGLATDINSEDSDVKPDYTIPVEEVYKRFTIWSIHQSKSLQSLSYVSTLLRSPQLSLTSWVPDYNRLELVPPLVRSEIEVPYDAAKGTEPKISFLDENNTLHVEGYVVDVLTTIGNIQADTPIPNPLPDFCSRVKEAQDSQALIKTSFWIKECLKIASVNNDEALTPERYVICNRTSTGQMAPPDYGISFKNYLKFFCEAIFDGYGDEWDRDMIESTLLFDRPLSGWPRHRCFCSTKNIRLGWVPKIARPGDLVCILDGGRVPYVLRPCVGDIYTWVGECYIHGLMEGEGVPLGDLKIQDFSIQ